MALTPPVIAGLVIFKLPAVEMLAIALIAGIAAQLVSRLLWRGLIPKPETSPIIAAVVGIALMVFLVFATVLLGYETFAVVHPGGDPPPITSYVRCAAADNPWVSELAAFILSVLLGNWIWYPSNKWPGRPWKDDD